MTILSHPFRLTLTGAAATVQDGSTPAPAEGVAVLALTRPGERPMCPTVGVTDPAFSGYDAAELGDALTLFGPPGVSVESIHSTPVDDRTAAVTITFTEQQEQP